MHESEDQTLLKVASASGGQANCNSATQRNFMQRHDQSVAFIATGVHAIMFFLLLGLAGHFFGKAFASGPVSQKLSSIHSAVYGTSHFIYRYLFIIIPLLVTILVLLSRKYKAVSVRQYAIIIAVWWGLIAVFAYIIVSPLWL